MTVSNALALFAWVLSATATPTTPRRQAAVTSTTTSLKPSSIGPRPRWLVQNMDASPLKDQLTTCLDDPAYYHAPNPFSIGHRGACQQFPEHTYESYMAAIEMGAGIVECDVAVTKDGELVCRHDQCDLHTSTNIVDTPLAANCMIPWNASNTVNPGASGNVKCCTSDITLAEFKTLKGKMDGATASATSKTAYMAGTEKWRTDLYSPGKLVTHKESIELIKKYGRKCTPELKKYTQGTGMPTYDAIRAKLVKEYTDLNFPVSDVFFQSFEMPDIEWMIKNAPDFGKQAVYLDDAYCDGTSGTQAGTETTRGCKNAAAVDGGGDKSPFVDGFDKLKAKGVNYIAPPMQMLLKADNGKYAPSEYAIAAKAAGLKIITWTFERAGPLATGGGWYFGTVNAITNNDGDMYELLHVLSKDVGIEGMFSDWPASVTFYANCVRAPSARFYFTDKQCSAKIDPRPRWLVQNMDASPLKDQLTTCLDNPQMGYTPHPFSIGHRGACQQFPEHTNESYMAAIEMGAGIVECDVAVTKDGELVCRHDQCDLHTSTNIVDTPLAANCMIPWNASNTVNPGASGNVKCCTSDITLAEFKTLKGKMDGATASATSKTAYMAGTEKWRTDLYSPGKLVTHKESIELIKKYGRKCTPELKKYTQGTGMPTYDAIRAKLVKEYTDLNFPVSDVFFQSFEMPDIEWMIKNAPDFGKQAVYLDDAYCDGTSGTQAGTETTRGCKNAAAVDGGGDKSPFVDGFDKLKAKGVNYIAPPMQMLLKADNGKYAPSEYAIAAKAAGLKIITWTFERAGPLATGGGWYFGTVNAITNNDGDMYELLHVLSKDVGIEGMFSDWPASVTFYANCVRSPSMCGNSAATALLNSASTILSASTIISGALALLSASLILS